MHIVGLTGSIAMGKSTVAKQFALLGALVCDSDALVHQLMGRRGEAVARIAAVFPESLAEDHIDRKILGRLVFGQPQKLKTLEAMLHPLVRKKQQEYIKAARKQGRKLLIMDIPLLFETNSHLRWDATIVVTAPAFLQRQRAMRRAGMTEEKLASIRARQMPDSEKRKKADFIVYTGLGKYYSWKQVKHIFKTLL